MPRTNFLMQMGVAGLAALNVWMALTMGNPLNWAVAVFAGLCFLKEW
jgi:hypothetical protein